jgi:hypothetical protein
VIGTLIYSSRSFDMANTKQGTLHDPELREHDSMAQQEYSPPRAFPSCSSASGRLAVAGGGGGGALIGCALRR